MVQQVEPPGVGEDVLQYVGPGDGLRVVALYCEALAAEDLVCRALAAMGLGPEVVVTVASVDAAGRPIVCLRLTAVGADRLARRLRDDRPSPSPHSDAA